jgi:hypothetical protein
VNNALDQYCDAIALGEIKIEENSGTTWTSLAAIAYTAKTVTGPVDISLEVFF